MQITYDGTSRLARECAQALRAFAFHPRVTVMPLQNLPAGEYQVTYNVRTLALDELGDCQWVDRVDMHVWMPPDFPRSPPLFRPMSAVFHPNISDRGVVGLPPWDDRQSLAQWITLVGFALSYRSFSNEQVVDENALAWVQANGQFFPTDREADFNPEAGESPLSRIAVHGPGALAQLRVFLNEQIAILRGQSPPTYDQVVSLSDSTRRQIAIFLPADIPADLRDTAMQLDEAFARLPGALGQFDLIRRQRLAIQDLRGARSASAEMAGRVDIRCKVCDDAFALNLPLYVRAAEAIRQVPQMALLQSWQEDLKSAAEMAQAFSDQLVAHQKALEEPPQVGRTFGVILDPEFNAAMAEIAAEIIPAAASAKEAIEAIQAAMRRATQMLSALQRCGEWRVYAELLERGVALERRMRGRDIASLQAFKVEAAGQTFGPFEMEQPLTLGSAVVTVLSLGRMSFEVVDAHSYRRLGASDTGKAVVRIADPASGESYEYQFSISHRCDETRAQIEVVARRTREMFTRLKVPVDTGESQIGQLAAAMGSPAGLSPFEARQREAEGRWAALSSDLGEMELLKERLATYFLITRYSGVVLADIGALLEARKRVHEAVAGLEFIKTRMINQKGRLMLPEEFVAEHARLTRQREQAEPVALGIQRRIDTAAKLIRHRLADPVLWGAAVYPAPRVLAPPGPELTQLILAASDDKLIEMIVVMEEKMHVQLCPPSWRSAAPAEAPTPEE